ncbi:MAG: ABC transporter ATP-binding protein/permease [Lachnospiraceae bacterium]|nr:ABC transporter ATP-binding protein/permease [Lachnospiraceae bacterium]
MLQITDISKEYKTGSYSQKALDHVSLSLRDNEFVAILGPSGSGKTTLLNMIGGLDRYDSGDLIINGTSTKKYRDRDWDSYRNHSVGFVFQSYNLIPHQTVLANVELALTISGVSGKERTRRAEEALKKVGLSDHMNKHPNQLSGGQMQRVAIARALVNEPDILLADEPTGALDSDTSVQVMELLKEVAEDRLVVLVTHNAELAEEYATRIVELKDGRIISDSDPYETEKAEAVQSKKYGKVSMSFLTALGLSFNNLKTKLKRTLLVSFAGSIGIIGIALILALSTGMKTYMDAIQKETLSGYPLRLQRQNVDITSLDLRGETRDTEESGRIRERQVIAGLFSTAYANDLGSLKKYLDKNRDRIMPYAQALEYRYNIAPLIFLEQDRGVFQVHPNKSFSSLGIMEGSLMSSSFSTMTDVFRVMPENRELYEDQYELKAGRWPENYNELVLVLTADGKVSDMTLYFMGLKDRTVLQEMIDSFLNGKTVKNSEKEMSFEPGDFIGISFRLVNRGDLYTYDGNYDLWMDRSEDTAYMRKLVANGEELVITGVVRPKDAAAAMILYTGINYMPSLTTHVVETAADSGPVKAQLKSPDTNILTGAPFEDADDASFPDLTTFFTVDTDAIRDAFSFDENAINIDPASFADADTSLDNIIDPADLAELFPEVSAEDISAILKNVKIDFSMEKTEQLFRSLLDAYLEYASDDPSTDYKHFPEAVRSYFETDEARAILAEDIREIISEAGEDIITADRLGALVDRVMGGFGAYVKNSGGMDPAVMIEQYMKGELDMSSMQALLTGYLTAYLQTDEVRQILQTEAGEMLAEFSVYSISEEQMSGLFRDLLEGYESYAEEKGLPMPSKLRDSFSEFLATDEAGGMIRDSVTEMINTDELEKQFSEAMSQYSEEFQDRSSALLRAVMSQIMDRIKEMMQRSMSSIAADLPNAFSVDTEAFADAIKMNLDDSELRSLIISLVAGEDSSYEKNLANFGYADLDKPYEILIYPVSFESKNEIMCIIDEYNDDVSAAKQDDKIIRYTDVVGTMMTSVTDIINAISYVLIAFVAVSLVVSSIMIGVITYISVLERRKEIGILRAIGASKRNVSSVFNAETFIIGALSGAIGIIMTELLLIPTNIIIRDLTGQEDLRAVLPIQAAIILILLSIALTLIGGFIPSKSAAKSDPVTALRTE